MAELNRVFLIGNLTRDPEVRYIPSGKAVADLRLAVNRRWKSSSGEAREDTCFIDATVWERQAETAAKYLKKGSPVFVEGSLQMDEWETEGEKRSRIKVNANRVQFLDRPARAGEYGDAPGDAGRPPASNNPPETSGGAGGTPEDGAGAADEDDLPF